MSTKIEQIVNDIKQMPAIELAELVKSIEQALGVSAAMAVAAPAAGAGAEAPKSEEKSSYKVELVDAGPNKMGVIKALRASVNGLGLIEAKKMAEETPPSLIGESMPKADAEKVKKALEEAGAKVKLS